MENINTVNHFNYDNFHFVVPKNLYRRQDQALFKTRNLISYYLNAK